MKDSNVNKLMQMAGKKQNDVLKATLHFQIIDGKIEILEAYELNEPSTHEAITFICHEADGSKGVQLKNDLGVVMK